MRTAPHVEPHAVGFVPARSWRRHALRGAAALAALSALAWVGIASGLAPAASSSARKAARFDPPTSLEIEAALARVGITLEGVAAAGLNGPQLTQTVGNAAASLRQNIAQLRAADEAAHRASADVERLESLITSGLSSGEDRAALTAARASLAAAQAQAQSVLQTAYAAGMTGFAPAPLATLETIQGNSRWEVAPQYRAVARPEDEWVRLRDALADQRSAPQLGREVDPANLQLITAANADPFVSAANANLNALESLRTFWNQALGQ